MITSPIPELKLVKLQPNIALSTLCELIYHSISQLQRKSGLTGAPQHSVGWVNGRYGPHMSAPSRRNCVRFDCSDYRRDVHDGLCRVLF